MTPGRTKFVSASRLRACIIKEGECEITIGDLIERTKGASQYPNKISYGDELRHFLAAVVAQMATMVAAYVMSRSSG
jgi:hypothetical protein